MEWIKYSLVYTADSIRDSIRTQKKRFAGPYPGPGVLDFQPSAFEYIKFMELHVLYISIMFQVPIALHSEVIAHFNLSIMQPSDTDL